jgi:hypothetical protein
MPGRITKIATRKSKTKLPKRSSRSGGVPPIIPPIIPAVRPSTTHVLTPPVASHQGGQQSPLVPQTLPTVLTLEQWLQNAQQHRLNITA